MAQPTILLCTVGTGNIDQLRATLLEPLKKSIRKGEWTQVVLLPSQLTADNAAVLQGELQDVPITVKPLPVAGAENHADACFAHFDRVLDELRSGGVPPGAILVDFTRGTKAMSAALVLAAVRHDLPQLRYIDGKRDERGMVVPGTEVVAEVHTTIATARKRLDDAFQFFRRGDFAAVLEDLPDPAGPVPVPWPQDLLDLATFARALAAFCAAWDRLDYNTALKVAVPSAGPRPSRWDGYVPPAVVRDWVAGLAQPLPDDHSSRAPRLRHLIADLLANGERRLRDHHYEDAVIRGYRVLELVGQIRLFDHGLASDALPPDHPVVREFQDEVVAEGRSVPMTLKDGCYQAAQEQVARLLKRLKDPLSKRLLRLGNWQEGEIRIARRNYSVWIHGFAAVAGSDPVPLRALYGELERLVLEDGGPEAERRLELARWLHLSGL